jgi:hypothetical protein
MLYDRKLPTFQIHAAHMLAAMRNPDLTEFNEIVTHSNSKAVYKQASNPESPDYSHFHSNSWDSNV